MHLGPSNNSRYAGDAPRLRQPVDGSADSERDSASSRQQNRNGNYSAEYLSSTCLKLLSSKLS